MVGPGLGCMSLPSSMRVWRSAVYEVALFVCL